MKFVMLKGIPAIVANTKLYGATGWPFSSKCDELDHHRHGGRCVDWCIGQQLVHTPLYDCRYLADPASTPYLMRGVLVLNVKTAVVSPAYSA